MVDTPGFFSPEAGAARRAALSDFLNENIDYYLGPTGIPDRLRAVGELFNPIAMAEDASTSAVRAADPDLPARERLGALGESALNVGLFGIPGALAYRGYLPTAEALAETLTGIGAASPEVQDAVRAALTDFGQSEVGAVGRGLGDNGGPPLDPEPRLGSRLMQALDQIGQRRGTYGQLRQRLIGLGGGAPAERELSFTGLDRMYRPDDRVTLDELRSYLEDTTDMFRIHDTRATGVTGGGDIDATEALNRAREVYEQSPAGQDLFDRALELVRDDYQDLYGAPMPDDEAFQMAQEMFDDDVNEIFRFLSNEEIVRMAGMPSTFDPGGTQYSSYITPGVSDYFEREYAFTDPGGTMPTGPRRLSGLGAHDFGNPEPGLVHTRGGVVSGLGGDDNTHLIAEIQSDAAQALRAQRSGPIPSTPETEALITLADAGTGRDIPEYAWDMLQRDEIPGLPDRFFDTRLVLNPDFTTPRAEDFTRAVSSAQTQARDYLRTGAEEVQRMRADLDAEAQEAMGILREGLEVEGSYLGYDTASGAVADINRTIRSAERTGQDPVEFVQQVYDIDPARSEREQFLSEALRRYVDHSYVSADRQTRVGRMRDLSESLGRYTGRSGDQTEVDYLRRLTDVDVPESYLRRIEGGEVLSPDDLRRVAEEYGPVPAAALAARNEFGLRNINPNALRDISGLSNVFRAGTYTPMPFIESTNQWVDYALRNELLQAAREGREYVAISNPEMVRAQTMGTEEGQGAFYGEIVPQRLRNLIRSLDRNAPSTTSADEFRGNPDMVFGPGTIQTDGADQSVIMVRLTPDLRARILGQEGYRGMTTFLRPEAALAGSGLASLALMGEEDEVDNY